MQSCKERPYEDTERRWPSGRRSWEKPTLLANTLIQHIYLPELWGNKFLLFNSPSLWYLFCLLLLLLSRFSCVRLCATPKMAAHQAPPSLGFSRQEHWSGLPFPSPMHESEKWKRSHSLMYRSVLWTLWEREREGRFGRMALKHV